MPIENLKITVLVDNTPAVDGALQCEHGLSLYVEADDVRVLCDMGASPLFLSNARAMGINLQKIDFAVLSHAHIDHSGGLAAVNDFCSGVPVYLSSAVKGARYYSLRGGRHSISPDAGALSSVSLRELPDSTFLTPDIAMVKCCVNDYPRPQGNCLLAVERNGVERPDDFEHEMSLAFRTKRGLVVVSPCSHCGAMNIMRSAMAFMGEERVCAFVGGLHFIDGDFTLGEVEQFVTDVMNFSPDMMICTGHCTCDRAKMALKALLPSVHMFGTGDVMRY